MTKKWNIINKPKINIQLTKIKTYINTQNRNNMSISALICSAADFLRGDYKQSDYGKIILPFTLLRRLEYVLEPTRDAFLRSMKLEKV